MRRLVLIGALLLLGGCNMVMTTTPLFTKADEGGSPGLRPGVWAGDGSGPCAFDEKTSVVDWPSCANGAIIGEGVVRSWQDKPGGGTQTSSDYILVNGDPRILQVHAVELAPGSGLSVSAYLYAGLRPTKVDDHGRITAYSAWLVMCGPPPPPTAADGGKISYGTHDPLPEMVMDKGGDDCTTSSTLALRNAAAASVKFGADLGTSRWVRDGDR